MEYIYSEDEKREEGRREGRGGRGGRKRRKEERREFIFYPKLFLSSFPIHYPLHKQTLIL